MSSVIVLSPYLLHLRSDRNKAIRHLLFHITMTKYQLPENVLLWNRNSVHFILAYQSVWIITNFQYLKLRLMHFIAIPWYEACFHYVSSYNDNIVIYNIIWIVLLHSIIYSSELFVFCSVILEEKTNMSVSSVGPSPSVVYKRDYTDKLHFQSDPS